MNIQHKEGANRGAFFVEKDGAVVAQLIYSNRGDKTLIIEHTEVGKDLRGKNIGYELVHQAVKYADGKGMKIIPACPFAEAVFQKKPEWKELLA